MAAKVSGIKATVDALTATATDVTGVANDNNVTKNQPISIGVNTAGNLVMMYAGSLSTGDAVKGGIYITSE